MEGVKTGRLSAGGEGVAAFTAVHCIAVVATVFFIGLTDGARAKALKAFGAADFSDL
ncbi:MAG: hypothetical protein J6P03_02755 [Opitutales bacterium]|nr:hypothetical protein [Opitutales bacterium]